MDFVIKNKMKTHTAAVADFLSYLNEDEPFHTFASSTKEPKQLQVASGKKAFRVFHGNELMYDGKDPYIVTSVYNNTTGRPVDPPKTDN